MVDGNDRTGRKARGSRNAGGMEDCMRKLVSIVIPCYRSAEMIGGVVADINREMEKLQEKYRWEIILVNHCSPDNTFDVIRELGREYTNICGINLARNFGQHAALMAGFHQVKGDILVCMMTTARLRLLQ